jgi:hypothetical protein
MQRYKRQVLYSLAVVGLTAVVSVEMLWLRGPRPDAWIVAIFGPLAATSVTIIIAIRRPQPPVISRRVQNGPSSSVEQANADLIEEYNEGLVTAGRYLPPAAVVAVIIAGAAPGLRGKLESSVGIAVVAGVLEFVAAALLLAGSLRPRVSAPTLIAPWPLPDLDTTEFGDPRGLVASILDEAVNERDKAQTYRTRWFSVNIAFAGLTALFAGASGVSGLLGDKAPTAVRVTFAGLALVGAGLSALSLALGAGPRAQILESRLTGLTSLVRELRFRLSAGSIEPDEPVVFLRRLDDLLNNDLGQARIEARAKN